MDKLDEFCVYLKVHADDLCGKVRDLLHEGNVRRISIRDEHRNTLMEIPVTAAAIGVAAAPVLAAVGAVATLVTHFEVVVGRVNPPDASAAKPPTSAPDDERRYPVNRNPPRSVLRGFFGAIDYQNLD